MALTNVYILVILVVCLVLWTIYVARPGHTQTSLLSEMNTHDDNLMSLDQPLTLKQRLLKTFPAVNKVSWRNTSTLVNDESAFYKVNIRDELANCLLGTPFDSLPDYKNPCWVSKMGSSEPYQHSSRLNICPQMKTIYEEHKRQDGFFWRMRCFPYVMQIGVSKSGTTDLHSRLQLHPEIFPAAVKEVRFWNRQRIGRLKKGANKDAKLNFTDFLDFFDLAANNIRNYKEMKNGQIFHPGITMEATPHYLWDCEGWEKIPGNQGLMEPRYILAHSLHKIRPDLKFLVIIRNPISRLFSHFHVKSKKTPSPIVFHDLVQESIKLWNQCLKWNTVRGCAYNASLIPREYTTPGGMTLRAGLYGLFLEDWFKLYPREHFHIIKAEDYYEDIPTTLSKVFRFLGLKSLSELELSKFKEARVINAYYKSNKNEPMLDKTHQLLHAFYKPFNLRLSALLKKDLFWE